MVKLSDDQLGAALGMQSPPISLEQRGIDKSKLTDSQFEAILGAPDPALSAIDSPEGIQTKYLDNLLTATEIQTSVVDTTKTSIAKEVGTIPAPVLKEGDKEQPKDASAPTPLLKEDAKVTPPTNPVEAELKASLEAIPQQSQELVKDIAAIPGQITEGITSGRVPVEAAKKSVVGIAQLPDTVKALVNLGAEKLVDKFPVLDRPKVRESITGNLQSSAENMQAIEEDANKIFPGWSKAQNTTEAVTSDIVSLIAGSLGGVKTVGKAAANKVLAEAAKRNIRPSTARLVIADSVGAAAGESVVTGTATDVAPFVLGDDHTPEVIQKRLLAPLEGGAIGLGVSAIARNYTPVMSRLFPAKFADVTQQGDKLIQGGHALTEEGLQELASTTALKMNDLAITFDLPASTIDSIMADGIIPEIKTGQGWLDELAIGTDKTEKIISRSAPTKYVNKWTKLMNVERERGKASNLNVGHYDILESSNLNRLMNQSGQSTIVSRSLIGDSGKRSVLFPTKETGYSLIERTDILPLQTIYSDAKQAGASMEELNKFFEAADALDDIANVQRRVTEIDTEIFEKAGKPVDEILTSVKATPGNKFGVGDLLTQREALLKFTPRMPEDAAKAIIASADSNPALKTALTEKNKLNNALLDMLTDSGKITTKDAERIRAVHQNYLPAWKDTIDVTRGDASVVRRPSISKGIRSRTGSGLKNVDPFEAQIRNIINTSRSAEQARINKGVLDFLLRSPDDEFEYWFREPKADVLNALNKLGTNENLKYLSANDITPSVNAEGVIERGDKLVFNVNGKAMQLTVKDRDLIDLLQSTQSPDQVSTVYQWMRNTSNLTRNIITVFDPFFGIRSVQREAQDFSAWTKRGGFVAPILRGEKPDYIPLFSNVKAVFAKETDPELFNFISANYGFSNIWGKRLAGLSTDEIVKESMNIYQSGAKVPLVDKIADGLYGFAERTDLAPRILSYKMMVKNGATHDEAMRVAFETGVNFAQAGTSQSFHKVSRLIPFSTAFINASDRLIRLGKYNPKKLGTSVMAVVGVYEGVKQYNSLWSGEDGIPYQDKLDPSVSRFTMPIYGPWSSGPNDYIPFSLGYTIGRTAPAFDRLGHYIHEKFVGSLEEHADAIVRADTPEAEELRLNKISGKDVANGFLNYLTDIASFPTSIPLVTPTVQALSNRDWRGRPIVNSHMKQTDDNLTYLEYDETTSPALVSAAAWLKRKTGVSLSPKTSEYWFEAVGAAAGKIALEIGNTMFLATNPDHPERPQLEKASVPGFKTLYGDSTSVDRTGISHQYFNIYSYVSAAKNQEDALLRQLENTSDPVEQAAVQHDLDKLRIDESDALHFHPAMEATSQAIFGVFSEMRDILGHDYTGSVTEEKELLGDPEKRKLITEKRLQIEGLQKRMLQMIAAENGAEELYYRRNDIGYTEELINDLTDTGKTVLDNFFTSEPVETKDAKGNVAKLRVLDMEKFTARPKISDADIEMALGLPTPQTVANLEDVLDILVATPIPVEDPLDSPHSISDSPDVDILATDTPLPAPTREDLEALLSGGSAGMTQIGMDFLKVREGFSASRYIDDAGYPTIGYGHRILPHEKFGTISKAQAEALLRADVAIAEKAVKSLVTVPLTDHQSDALVSFAYNVGVGKSGFAGSTLLKKLNEGDYEGAAQQFTRWIHAGGRPNKGLLARRKMEMQMFKGVKMKPVDKTPEDMLQ